jgi:DDE domain
MSHRPASVPARRSSLAGFRFPPEVIMLAVRWYLRYRLCYRDVEELLAERGITVDHVTIYRWVQRFTPELIDAARPSRHVARDRWFVDQTYLKVAGRWVYVHRTIDQYGQVIDVLASPKRDLVATRRFFARALNATPTAHRGDHRPGPGLPAGARRAGSRGVARGGAVRQQPPRSRSRPAEGSDPTERFETAPLRPGRRH